MALGTFVAGPYTSTYNWQAAGAVDLGITEKGYNLSVQHVTENVDETDTYGRSVIDQIYQGTNVTLDMVCKEYKASPLRALHPWNATAFAPTGASAFRNGLIGLLATAADGVLILTAATGTSAAAAPATLTVTHAIIHESFDLNWLLGPSLRKIPLKFRALPYLDTTIKIFSTT